MEQMTNSIVIWTHTDHDTAVFQSSIQLSTVYNWNTNITRIIFSKVQRMTSSSIIQNTYHIPCTLDWDKLQTFLVFFLFVLFVPLIMLTDSFRIPPLRPTRRSPIPSNLRMLRCDVLVLACLDYCNGLLSEASQWLISPLSLPDCRASDRSCCLLAQAVCS